MQKHSNLITNIYLVPCKYHLIYLLSAQHMEVNRNSKAICAILINAAMTPSKATSGSHLSFIVGVDDAIQFLDAKTHREQQ